MESSADGGGEDDDDNDEEDVDELLSALNDCVDGDSETSHEQKVVAKLLTKVRAFISKVRCMLSLKIN